MRTELRKRILVVDDQEVVTDAITAILEIDGHAVESVSSALAALGKYERQRYDLIVTDYPMPGMTGLELAETIKSQDSAQPILLLTGCPPRGSQPNVDLVMRKPFSVDDLRSAVNDLASRPARARWSEGNAEALRHHTDSESSMMVACSAA